MRPRTKTPAGACRAGWRLVCLALVCTGLASSVSAQSQQQTAAGIDASSGLVLAPGWQLVQANCGACHSYRLITQQRGDARFWLDTIRWMQRTQNLWPLPEEHESTIVEYLAQHYNESDWGRRPAIAPSLLPETGAD